MSEIVTKEGLKRVMNAPALAATIVNNTIGAGIYALPAIVAIQVGGASILEYVFCAVMLVAIMLCYAEIGTRVTSSGGSYIYIEAAFGPFAGFVINWLFFFGWGVLGSAALMNVVGDSLAVLFPIFSQPLARDALFLALLGSLALINVLGAKQGIGFIKFLTLIKLIPFFAIIIFGFSQVKTANLRVEHLPSLQAFGETALVLFFGFAGFETSMSASGEIENPKRTVPRGILLGGALVFIIYLLLQTVTQGIRGAQIGQFKDAPLAAVAGKIVGTAGATLILVAAIVSCIGNTSGDLLASPRLLFAGANDGLFPKPLGKVHRKFATPYVAIITYASLILILSTLGGFKALAVLASGSLLIIDLGVVLAMIKFRFSKNKPPEKAFKAPGGFAAPLVAVATIIWLLSHLSYQEKISTLIFIAIVCAVYLVMRFTQKSKLPARSNPAQPLFAAEPLEIREVNDE